MQNYCLAIKLILNVFLASFLIGVLETTKGKILSSFVIWLTYPRMDNIWSLSMWKISLSASGRSFRASATLAVVLRVLVRPVLFAALTITWRPRCRIAVKFKNNFYISGYQTEFNNIYYKTELYLEFFVISISQKIYLFFFSFSIQPSHIMFR